MPLRHPSSKGPVVGVRVGSKRQLERQAVSTPGTGSPLEHVGERACRLRNQQGRA